MNSDVVQSIVQMKPQILKQLVTEVKETVATGVGLHPVNESNNSFSIVNLWNIRKSGRLSGSHRRKPRIVTGFGY